MKAFLARVESSYFDPRLPASVPYVRPLPGGKGSKQLTGHPNSLHAFLHASHLMKKTCVKLSASSRRSKCLICTTLLSRILSQCAFLGRNPSEFGQDFRNRMHARPHAPNCRSWMESLPLIVISKLRRVYLSPPRILCRMLPRRDPQKKTVYPQRCAHLSRITVRTERSSVLDHYSKR